jgi:hypothetical protein
MERHNIQVLLLDLYFIQRCMFAQQQHAVCAKDLLATCVTLKQHDHPLTLSGSAGSTLARTLPSLSVLTNSGRPVALLQHARDVTMDCRWPNSRLASTAAGSCILPSASAAAAAGAAVPAAAGRTVAVRTSPNLSEKNMCWLSAENVQLVAFLPDLLQQQRHTTKNSVAA